MIQNVNPFARTGKFLSGLAAFLLALDSLGKLLRAKAVLAGTAQLGYSVNTVVPLGIVLLACVVIYLVPRTAAGRVAAHGVSWRGGGHSRPRRESAVHARAVSDLRRGVDLGRADAARRAPARARPVAEAGMSETTSLGRNEDRLREARQRPCRDPRGWRVLQPRVRAVPQNRAAAGAEFTVIHLRSPRTRPERRRGGLLAGARSRGSRRADQGGRAAPRVSSVFRQAARSRSRPRPADCTSPRSSPTSRPTSTMPAPAPARLRRHPAPLLDQWRSQRRREVLHEGHGRRPRVRA